MERIPVSGKPVSSGFLYKLDSPAAVPEGGKVFFIEYVSDSDREVELLDSSGRPVRFSIPAGGSDSVRYQFPLKRGFSVDGFIVDGVRRNGEGFSLVSGGFEDGGYGYYISGGTNGKTATIIDGFVRNGDYSFSFAKLSEAVDLRMNQVQIAVRYRCGCSDVSYSTVVLASGEKSRKHIVSFRNTEETLYFYSDEEGFVPVSLEILNAPESLEVLSVEVKEFSRLVPISYTPVPADFGVILGYGKESWRRSDFEIFSWSLFPGFLVLEFNSYALQASFLKRLAFFVEKKGFAGKLLPDSRLKKLHGWNAHDYRADDLARFFNTAADQGFVLNSDEYRLRDILVSNGILKVSDGRVIPVSGGFLSFSSESSLRLRRLFITHEGYHGVFFSSPGYRSAVERIWNGLSEDEKNFWREFLDWKKYNIDDKYLVINEFQAYLMQQRGDRIDSYYKDYIIPRMKRSLPSVSSDLDSFTEKYPDHFTNNSSKVQDALFKVKGLTAGELRSVMD